MATERIQDPYAPPRSSVVNPHLPEMPADYWPAVIKLLTVCLILECVSHVILPMMVAGGLTWPYFGKLFVSLAVLFSVFKRNRWGWILAVAVPVLATPVSIYLIYPQWESVAENLGTVLDAIPSYHIVLAIPGTVAFVLLFLPPTIRWYFGKHSQRHKLVTSFIWCVVMTGYTISAYSTYLGYERSLDRYEELNRLIEENQELEEELRRQQEELEDGERSRPLSEELQESIDEALRQAAQEAANR